MARIKLVNGVAVPMTPQEEAERDAEELAWANRPPDPPAPLTAEELYDMLAAKTPPVITPADRPRPKPPPAGGP